MRGYPPIAQETTARVARLAALRKLLAVPRRAQIEIASAQTM